MWVCMRCEVSACLVDATRASAKNTSVAFQLAQESKNSSYWMVPSIFTSILANLRLQCAMMAPAVTVQVIF